MNSFSVTDIHCEVAKADLWRLIKNFRKECADLVQKGRKYGVRIKFKQPMPEFNVTIEPRRKS